MTFRRTIESNNTKEVTVGGEQIRKQGSASDAEIDAVVEMPAADVAQEGQAIVKGLDEVLDEIDGVLEHNAEDFVKSYIQKGGQ